MDLREKTANTSRHPWELSRAGCLLNIIKKYRISAACDIGAGDRFFALKLLSLVEGPVYAVDSGYAENAAVIDGIRCANDISAIPELPADGGIVMMDVLEHIQDDTAFLAKVLRKIPKGGFVFVTVPAFQFLFSAHDVFLKHYRRYNRKQLLALLEERGLRVERCHYFYGSLFWVRFAQTLLPKKAAVHNKGIGGWRFSEKHILTRLIRAVLSIDFYCCAFFAKSRIYAPGLSLLAVCRKQADGGVGEER
jgi:hypothetical protein